MLQATVEFCKQNVEGDRACTVEGVLQTNVLSICLLLLLPQSPFGDSSPKEEPLGENVRLVCSRDVSAGVCLRVVEGVTDEVFFRKALS